MVLGLASVSVLGCGGTRPVAQSARAAPADVSAAALQAGEAETADPSMDAAEPDAPEADVPEPDVPEPDVPEPDVPEPELPLPGAEAERWAQAHALLSGEVEGYRALMSVVELEPGPAPRLLATFEYDPRATEDGLARPVSRRWCEHVAACVLAVEGDDLSLGEWFEGPFLCALDAAQYRVADFDADGEPELWFAELRSGTWEYDFETGDRYFRGPVETVAAIYDPRTLEPELEIPIGHAPGEREERDGAYVGSCTWWAPEDGGPVPIRCETERLATGAVEATRWVYAGDGRWRAEPIPLDDHGEPVE